MAVFQTVTVKADPNHITEEALKNLVPCHSLGAAIQRYGVRIDGKAETEKLAEDAINKKHQKGMHMMAVQIGETKEWVVGGRFRDDITY